MDGTPPSGPPRRLRRGERLLPAEPLPGLFRRGLLRLARGERLLPAEPLPGLLRRGLLSLAPGGRLLGRGWRWGLLGCSLRRCGGLRCWTGACARRNTHQLAYPAFHVPVAVVRPVGDALNKVVDAR
ncbi:hypothetical protein, partial [Frankia sp. CcWB2]